MVLAWWRGAPSTKGAADDVRRGIAGLERAAGGGIPAPVTMLLEGEEEIGSPNLGAISAANKS